MHINSRYMMKTSERYYKKNPDFVHRKIAGELILVPIRQKIGDLESIFTLNEVAGFIWEQIDGKKNLDAIKEAVLNEFDVKPSEAEKDLKELLQQLEEIGAAINIKSV